MYTGNTVLSFVSPVCLSVYPCVYREHRYFRILPRQNPGLSLCIQGTHLKYASQVLIGRFIPVYTGNTPMELNTDILSAVYPCVYREHAATLKPSFSNRGLSLCIQGTPVFIEDKTANFRFIPVYTGNT